MGFSIARGAWELCMGVVTERLTRFLGFMSDFARSEIKEAQVREFYR